MPSFTWPSPCTTWRRRNISMSMGLVVRWVGSRTKPSRLDLRDINLWRMALQQGIYPRHFGLVLLSKGSWQQLLEQAQSNGLFFYQQPRVRFPGTRIEHHTFFLEDPSGNLLEFKYYLHESAIFGERECREVGDSSEHDE